MYITTHMMNEMTKGVTTHKNIKLVNDNKVVF